ncbi:unnamed protein product [Brachionus calyciflorus]|uniref:Uncharacterized protein n=1 Tax=Brachionus calyciflorus TaxID=104777 RepID=A0A813LWN5_9BILA|nr:unnamed protein product [Brachionus calyciflorus]
MSSDDDEYQIPLSKNRKNSEKSNIKMRLDSSSSSDEGDKKVFLNSSILMNVRFSSLKKSEENSLDKKLTKFNSSESDSESEKKGKIRRGIFDSDPEDDTQKISNENNQNISRKISIKSEEPTTKNINVSKQTGEPSQTRQITQKISTNLEMQEKYDFSKNLFNQRTSANSLVTDVLINNFKNDLEIDKSKTIIKENTNLKTTLCKTNAEIRFLVEKYEDKPDCKEIINRILLDKPFWFDLYRNKRDKINLLNEAIVSSDGNAILAAVLYIRRTLNQEIFFEIIVNNQIALNQYTFYLKQMNDVDELAALEKYRKNPLEISILFNFYKVICDKTLELNEKLRLFHDYERRLSFSEISQVKNTQIYQAAFKHITLLKIQKEINKNRALLLRKESHQDPLDNLYENTMSYTLSFCIKYSKDLAENQLYSTDHFKKEFELTGKEYSIWFIKTMSEIGQWSDIENFLNQKKFFSIVQRQQNVRYETILSILYYAKAPEEILKKYLSLVEDLENRRILANKLKFYDVVIETFKLQKDRVGLLNFRNTFKEDSLDFIKANIVLKDDKVNKMEKLITND